MKIDIDLPWDGKLHFERQPMSEDTRFTVTMFLGTGMFLLFLLAMFWMFR